MKRGLSQEWLKGIACVAMLLDHIGAALVPWVGLRILGRIAFPIFCFLLTEGIYHTRDPRKYGLRLLAGAVLAEIPFDLLLFGGVTLAHCSAMVTLLLGFFYGEVCKSVRQLGHRILLLLPFMAAADFLGTDYGAVGIGMIAVFFLTREMPRRRSMQTVCLAALCYMMNSYPVQIGTLAVPIEMFALLAMVPIICYDGHKLTQSKGVQWGFYLFYPVHLAALLIVSYL